MQTADALPAAAFTMVGGVLAVHPGAAGALYQDAKNARLFVEQFSVPSWEEHLRHYPTRSRIPTTTWPPMSASSQIAAERPSC